MAYKPFFVGWDITNKCNLNCKHCNRSSGNKLKNELSFFLVKKVIDQLARDFKSIEHLSFGGGEPLMRKDFLKIVEYAISKKLPVRINTNGLLISDSIAKTLKKMGVYHIQISIDGNEKNHDFVRGKGNYKKSIEKVKILKKYNISTSFRMTLFKNNYKDAEPLYDIANRLKIERFSIGRGIDCGRLNKNSNLVLPKDKYFKVLGAAYQKAKNKKTVYYCTDPLSLFSNISRMKKILNRYDIGNYLGGCIAGIAQFFISAEGKVFGCGLLDVEAGDIRKDNLLNIWKNSPLFQKLRERRNKFLKDDYCGNCSYNSICGGCRAAAYYNNGNIFGKDPFCKFKKCKK